MRPHRDNIAAPVLPPGCAGCARRAPACSRARPGDRRAHRRRPAAGPLLRLRPAQQRPRAPLRRSPGTERYREAGLATLGHPLAPLRLHRRARRRSAPALERLGSPPPGRRRLRLRGLARLRLQGLAVALPLGPGRRAALVSLRRGRVRGDRAGDRRRAGGARPAASQPPPPLRAAAADRRAGRARRPAERRAAAGRLGLRPVAAGGGRGRARARVRGRRRARLRRRRGRAPRRARRRGRPDDRGRPPRASTTSPSTPATSATRCASRPSPGIAIYSLSFSAGLP